MGISRKEYRRVHRQKHLHQSPAHTVYNSTLILRQLLFQLIERLICFSRFPFRLLLRSLGVYTLKQLFFLISVNSGRRIIVKFYKSKALYQVLTFPSEFSEETTSRFAHFDTELSLNFTSLSFAIFVNLLHPLPSLLLYGLLLSLLVFFYHS